jgi:DNA polymerase
VRSACVYEGSKPLALAVEDCLVTERTPECDRCKLNTDGVRSPCISGEGEAGGVLLVGESPGRNEDALGRPFIGKSGQLLRTELAAHWSGPVAFDNAIRCAPGRTEIRPKMVDQCRTYLAATIKEAYWEHGPGWQRIICLGAKAAYSVAGRNVPPLSTRRGYSFLSDGTPVFFVLHPAAALRNRFIMEWFKADLQWALTTEPDAPAWDGNVFGVENAVDARKAVTVLRNAAWAAFDVETSGEMWRGGAFEIISLAATPEGSCDSFVWDSKALESQAVRAPLMEWLVDPTALKVGQNVKYDQLSCLSAWGIRARGVIADTRLLRKLLEPEASAALDDMAELVGMGGMKQEAGAAMKKMVATIKRNLKKTDGTPLLPGLDKVTEAAIRLGVPPERFAYKLLPREKLDRYNARDGVATARLGTMLQQQGCVAGAGTG